MIRISIIFFLSLFTFLHANALQKAIDSAPEGAILKLPAGVYKGSIIINKPLTIIGKEDGVIIDGEGTGTVIAIKSSYVTLKNIRVTNSGSLHHQLDAGITVENAKQCEIS
ncbi:MAG: nitrous oxide reductase family maturation protein NosD, partial [Campylobacterota bacterium]|nr:nitrous oxide reductase family maturation protein NosD [Campylobacterota bacterium]